MIFRQFTTPELAIYSYLLGDSIARRAVVIDPTREVGPYIDAARAAGVEIVAILETHVHADFVSGAKELKSALKGKPLIYASKMGGPAWTPRYCDRPVADGDEIAFGTLRLVAKHTPGHTPEHLIWLCYDDARSRETPWFMFSGDLLFVGGVGRPDLLGKEAVETLSLQLYHSLFHTLAQLPDFVEIYPAHGSGSLCGKGMSDRTTSTLGYERSFNPSLQQVSEDQFIANLLEHMPAAPLHFQQIKKINVEGPSLLAELSQVPADNPFIIDTRHPLKFAEGHLAGAVNIFYGSAFCNWAAMVVPENRPLMLVVDEGRGPEVERLLHLIGYDQIVGFRGSETEEKFAVTTPQQLTSNQTIIDVRTPAEWDSGHIEGALHIELARLPLALNELPKDRPIATICGGGFRSSIAASWLKQAGFARVASVWGGMQAWRQANYPK